MRDIEEVVRVTYERAHKETAHPVYPQHDDLAQNCLKNWVARGYKNPKTTTTYTLLNNFNRQTKPEFKKSYNTIEIEDFMSEASTNPYSKVRQNMYLGEFFDWIESKYGKTRHYDMMYRNTFLDEGMTSIATDYKMTRQALHVAKTKLIEGYKQHLNDKIEK